MRSRVWSIVASISASPSAGGAARLRAYGRPGGWEVVRKRA